MKTIPHLVIEAAEGRKFLGRRLRVLCKYNNEEVYSYEYDEEVTIGYPEFYLWDGVRCLIVTRQDALELLGKLNIEE